MCVSLDREVTEGIIRKINSRGRSDINIVRTHVENSQEIEIFKLKKIRKSFKS